MLPFGVASLPIFPLRAAESVLGFLTLGRISGEPFEPHSVQSALALARLAPAAPERDALRHALKEGKPGSEPKG